MTKQARDTRQEITDQIIALIESGQTTGQTLWDHSMKFGLPRNFATGKSYSGVNVLTLIGACVDRGFDSNEWLTFNQAKALGGNVKKGAKAVTGVFYKFLEHEVENKKTGDLESKKFPMLSTFSLFNVSEIEGLPSAQKVTLENQFDPIEAADRLVEATGAQVCWGGAKAFYRPSSDEIYMPSKSRFEHSQNAYAVLLHELSHWTGHESRLARNFEGRFGDEAYAVEELIAELSAAYLCSELGIVGRLENHASYLNSWLRVLKSDKNAIFTAAAQASKSFDFIMASQSANDAQAAQELIEVAA